MHASTSRVCQRPRLAATALAYRDMCTHVPDFSRFRTDLESTNFSHNARFRSSAELNARRRSAGVNAGHVHMLNASFCGVPVPCSGHRIKEGRKIIFLHSKMPNFLRLSNTLRNSHGEEIRPDLQPSVSNPVSEEAITFDERTSAQDIPATNRRRRTSSMSGGGSPLPLAPIVAASSLH